MSKARFTFRQKEALVRIDVLGGNNIRPRVHTIGSEKIVLNNLVKHGYAEVCKTPSGEHYVLTQSGVDTVLLILASKYNEPRYHKSEGADIAQNERGTDGRI